MTAAGVDPEVGMKYAKIIGEKEEAVETVTLYVFGYSALLLITGCEDTRSAVASSISTTAGRFPFAARLCLGRMTRHAEKGTRPREPIGGENSPSIQQFDSLLCFRLMSTRP
jgi:hypothetical protein